MYPVQQVVSQLNSIIFAKDLSHRIIYCNERFAQVSGEASPAACHGKTDAQFIWKKHTHLYWDGDVTAFRGSSLFNVIEPQRQVHGDAMILLNKHPLLNAKGIVIGVVGSYIDVTGLRIHEKQCGLQADEQGFSLGGYFDNAMLSSREFQVLKQILLGRTAKDIGSDLFISQKTVETHVSNIKTKMQCKTRGDIISQAVYSGLYYKFLNEFNFPDSE